MRQGPRVLYTDIQSGPTTSGEDNLGIYLSVFGTRFWNGTTEPSRAERDRIKVFVGSQPVAAYRHYGVSRGRPDIQQITVQIGPLRHVKTTRPLPVVVEVAGKRSNADLSFLPNTGRIFFVDNEHGDDATGVAGDVRHPYRRVQTQDPRAGGVWPHIEPGDFIVMRGTGTPWHDSGLDGYFLRFDKSGTTPEATPHTGPITLMGYPGEDVFIDETYAVSTRGAISGMNGPHGRVVRSKGKRNSPATGAMHENICEQNRSLRCSQWINVVGLRIEAGGDDGPINLQIGGNHWRVINNSVSAATARDTARSGGITGDGLDVVILGNTIDAIHSPDPGLQNHGIYIDGPGSYRIEYNSIHDVRDDSGFQVYGDETPTGTFIANDILFAHNWIDHVAKYCINLADNSGSNFLVYDNVSSYCGLAGLRINSPFLHGARLYQNTFYATDTLAKQDYGAIVIDSKLSEDSLDVENNIFVTQPHTPYMGGDNPLTNPSASVHFAGNLYFNGIGDHPFDPGSLTADPNFVDPKSCDFHSRAEIQRVNGDSPSVHKFVLDDFDFLLRDPTHPYDIGAYSHHDQQ